MDPINTQINIPNVQEVKETSLEQDISPNSVQSQNTTPSSEILTRSNVGYTPNRPIQSINFKDMVGWQLHPNGEVSFSGSRLISTHFTPIIYAKTITIYVSDGTTPNGNLSGNAGDICFGADGGKAYKCTSTTTWVSFT